MALVVSPLFAQNLSMGAVLGTNLMPSFQPFLSAPGISYANTPTLLCGADAEWSFPGPISIEGDVLYRRLHVVGDPLSSSFSVVTWEFPILAKYRFSLPHLSPFLEAGTSFRATGNLNGIHPSHYGFTAGIGVDKRVGRLHIEPTLRYTRWAQDLPSLSDVRTEVDQLEFVVGLRPPSLSNTHPFGAHISLGAVAGTNLTGDFGKVTSPAFPPALANSGYTYQLAQLANATYLTSAGPRSFLAGPQITLALPRRFSIAVEAVYRPLRSSVEIFPANSHLELSYQDHRSTWEFPVLAQYHWRIRRAKPFLELGPSFRLLQDVYGASPYGVAAGAGVETNVGKLKIAPRLRFTHWAQQEPAVATDPRRGEVAILTGFSF